MRLWIRNVARSLAGSATDTATANGNGNGYSSGGRRRTGTHLLLGLVAELALQPGPLDGADQGVAKVLAEQAVDVEGQRVVDQLQQIGAGPEHLEGEARIHLRGDRHVKNGHGRDADQEQNRGAAEQQEQSSLLGELARIIVLHKPIGMGMAMGMAMGVSMGVTMSVTMSMVPAEYHLATTLAGAPVDHHDAHVEAADQHGGHQLEDHLQHDLVDAIEDGLLVDGVVAPQANVHVAGAQDALDQLATKDARQIDDHRGQAGEEDHNSVGRKAEDESGSRLPALNSTYPGGPITGLANPGWQTDT